MPWHFLYFLPLPHGHGSFRPTLGSSRRTVCTGASSPPTRGGAAGRDGIPAGIGAAAARGKGANAATGSAFGSFNVIGTDARRCGARFWSRCCITGTVKGCLRTT